MSVGPAVQVHPAVAGVEALSALLAEVAALPVELLDTRSAGEVLVGLARLGDQVASLRMRVLAAADGVAAVDGARDPGAWLAHRTRGDRGAHQRELRLGRAFAERWLRVGDGLAEGRVNLAQARVIVEALDALPADVPGDVVARAEDHLLALAADFGPQQLRVLGRKVVDVVAPEVGEAHEARALAEEERRARDASVLAFQALGDGRTRLRAVVPDAVALRLRTYLESFTSPRHDAASGGLVRRPAGAAPPRRGVLLAARGDRPGTDAAPRRRRHRRRRDRHARCAPVRAGRSRPARCRG